MVMQTFDGHNNDDGDMTDRKLRELIMDYFDMFRIRGNWYMYGGFYSSNTGMSTDWDSLVWDGIENSDEDYADRMVEMISTTKNLQTRICNNFIQVYNSMNCAN
jgi:hypothetical protein